MNFQKVVLSKIIALVFIFSTFTWMCPMGDSIVNASTVIEENSSAFEVVIGNQSGLVGDLVNVPIMFKNVPSNGINNGNFSLLYDKEALEVVSVQKGNIIPGIDYSSNLASSKIYFLFISLIELGENTIKTDGSFAIITFRIKETASIGVKSIYADPTYTFAQENDEGLFSRIDTKFISGSIVVESKQTSGTPESTDVHSNTPIPTETPMATYSPTPISEYKVDVLVGNVNSEAGKLVRVPVAFKNIPSIGINNFEFNLKYDQEALVYQGVSYNRSIANSNGGYNGLMVGELPEGMVKFVFDAKFKQIKEDGIVAILTFIVKDNTSNGKYKIYQNGGVSFSGLTDRLVKEIPMFSYGSITVENKPVLGAIDFPTNNMTIKGETRVFGWVMDMKVVKKLEVMIDGVYVGDATYGKERIDVFNKYPSYQNRNSGFVFYIQKTSLKDGKHTIKIIETNGKDKKTEVLTREFIFENQAIGYIDSPVHMNSYSGMINVSGWVLDYNEVEKIEVLVDDVVVGNALYGSARNDVFEAYPEYNNKNSGFYYILDGSKFSEGKHIITIRVVGNGKQVVIGNKEINSILPVKCFIDTPVQNAECTGTIKVSGWILDPNGFKNIEVLVDDIVKGQATYGLKRSDVLSAYLVYGNENSGFIYDLDTNSLSSGTHTITIRESGNTDKVSVFSKNINKK